jgi:phosphatidylinositol-3-phosphatase
MKAFFFAKLILFCSALINISRADLPSPDHIVIVIMENHGYNQIIGSSNAPYINSLANDPKGALFTNSHGLTHPSQPNYLMLYSGSNQGVTNDNLPTGLPFLTLNLGASLIDADKTFTGYSEDLPYAGYNGATYGYYARKHNPWVNWQDSPTNGYPITVNQPLTSLPTDYQHLPAVSVIVPNLIHDMHDGTIQQGDTWLQNNINSYVNWAKVNNSLLILTFDEDNNTSPNQIPTIFVGEHVLHGQYSDYITHYNILRTVEDIYSLPRAGATNSVSPITNCWVSATGIVNNSLPLEFKLEQNFPNPFNPVTVIRYSLIENHFITLKVYDVLGNEVATLVNEKENAGSYEVEFNAANLSSGIYFYKLSTDGFTETKRMILLK